MNKIKLIRNEYNKKWRLKYGKENIEILDYLPEEKLQKICPDTDPKTIIKWILEHDNVPEKIKNMLRNWLRKLLRNYTTINSDVKFKPKREGEKPLKGKVKDEVFVVLDNGDKHFIQKIKADDGKYHYRFCYYTLNKKETEIVFGQFASTMPEKNFKRLIKKAIEKFK